MLVCAPKELPSWHVLLSPMTNQRLVLWMGLLAVWAMRCHAQFRKVRQSMILYPLDENKLQDSCSLQSTTIPLGDLTVLMGLLLVWQGTGQLVGNPVQPKGLYVLSDVSRSDNQE